MTTRDDVRVIARDLDTDAILGAFASPPPTGKPGAGTRLAGWARSVNWGDTAAAGLTITVAAGAMIGSADELYRIATVANLSAPWSLPVALDCSPIVAAIAVRRHRSNWLAWLTLVAATGLSALLQWGIGSVRPVAALLTFELFLQVTTPPTVKAGRRARRRARKAGDQAAEKAAPAAPVKRRPPAPVKAVAAEVTPGALVHLDPPADLDDDVDPLLPVALGLAEADGPFRSRVDVRERLADAGHRVGNDRANRLHQAVRAARGGAS